MLLSENEWYLINSIILDIHQASNHKEMRCKFLERISFLIPYDKANFFLASDTNEHYITDAVDIGFQEEYLQDYFDNLENHDFTNWIYASAQNEVYLLSDLLSMHEQKESIYFQNYYYPNEIEYAIITSLAWNRTHVGTVSLFRSRKNENFTIKDKQIFTILKNHLALALYRILKKNSTPLSMEAQWAEKIIAQYQLTSRESEILQLLLEGESSIAICQKLCISSNTLRKHTSNIYKKFGVNKRNELNRIFYPPQNK